MKIALAEAVEEEIAYIITGPNKTNKNFIANLIDTTYPDECVIVNSKDIGDWSGFDKYCLIIIVDWDGDDINDDDIKNREIIRIHIE